MKHVTATFLFLGLSAFCVVGQNVTVMMKDGSSHKFNADYLSEITFQDVVPETPPVEFKTIGLDSYPGGNVMVTLADAGAANELKLDMYGPDDSVWMQTGTYTYAETCDPYTVCPRYSKAKVNGSEVKFTDATIVVTQEEKIYTFDVKLTLEDGSEFKGIYKGELPSYTPWINLTLEKADYNENPQEKGDFRVNFRNDVNESPYYEMSFIFTADASAKTLPEGVYTLSETREAGTISTRSSIEQYYPTATLQMTEGSKVTVTKDGENYNIVMELNFADGRTGNFTYNGPINGTPTFENPAEEWASVSDKAYGNTNVTLTFWKTAGSASDGEIKLDCYFPEAQSFPEGTFVLGNSSTSDKYINSSYSWYTPDGEYSNKVSFSSCTLNVTLDGEIYTFDFEGVLADGKEISMTCTSKLTEFGVSKTVEKVMSVARYEENNARPAGNMRVKFNDADYSVEMALDMFAPASETTIPAGTYTFATTGAEYTFGSKSEVSFYSPYYQACPTEGSTVVVTKNNDGVYNFDMNLLLPDGRVCKFTFNGNIVGTPKFE